MECSNTGTAGPESQVSHQPDHFAECSVGYERIEEVVALFKYLRFIMISISQEALFLAGKAFLQYRKRNV